MKTTDNEKSQADKFQEGAREAETDDRGDVFDELVKKIAGNVPMKVFKLSPVDSQSRSRDWAASNLEPIVCWVLARTADDARLTMELATARAVKTEFGQPIRFSPWRNPSLVEVTSGSDVPGNLPEGVILTSDGRTITVE